MSLLDGPKVNADQAKKLHKKEQSEKEFWKNLINMKGVYGIELEESFDLYAKLVQALGEYNEEQNPFVSKIVEYAHAEGRKVYGINCKLLRKHDAIGFLEWLSLQPTSSRPIVIIQNITEIPFGKDIYDDAQYVEDILVHSWKNETNHLTNKNGEQFILKSHDYTVFLTWSARTTEMIKNVWRASDGLGWIGNLNDYKKAFFDSKKL